MSGLHRALAATIKEVGETAHSIEKRWPSQTRGDLLRRIRAALELQPDSVPRENEAYDPKRDPRAES
jgi:hypothetical protein